MASQYPPHVYSSQSTATSYTVNTKSLTTSGSINITLPNHGFGAYPYAYSTAASNISSAQSSLTVTGDATFDGDVKVKGRSLEKLFNDVEKRLAILVPDPKKLAKWEALRKAYDHYKLLEALLHEEDKEDGC